MIIFGITHKGDEWYTFYDTFYIFLRVISQWTETFDFLLDISKHHIFIGILWIVIDRRSIFDKYPFANLNNISQEWWFFFIIIFQYNSILFILPYNQYAGINHSTLVESSKLSYHIIIVNNVNPNQYKACL